eukprot:TRINITY_DN1341_c0_g1_i2.p1 TRINITY_DN1341_c0_g1~~TRINITY_DN1341_c0_g1_i2.p1  ORF type:complete len:153 (-),score=25.12 TRINITY_DN1341_c0_g1_i2:23-460(-)
MSELDSSDADSLRDSSFSEGMTQQYQLYENTYIMEPKEESKFNVSEVEKVIKAHVDAAIEDREYSTNDVESLIPQLSNDILQAVKNLGYERYKLVSEVQAGSVEGQGLTVGSRALWLPETDSQASYSAKNETLWITGMVFGIYFE